MLTMKKSLATLTLTALALSATVIPGLMSRHSASAESKLNSSKMAPAAGAAAQALTTTSGVFLPNRNIYTLNNNNVLFVMYAGTTSFTRLVRLVDGISRFTVMDFRLSDNRLYALSDTGT